MGLEVAEQFGWKRLPTHIIYPTGGGTGLIGMWKVFRELIDLGWLPKDVPLPRMIVAQATGCAPIVRAHQAIPCCWALCHSARLYAVMAAMTWQIHPSRPPDPIHRPGVTISQNNPRQKSPL